MKYAHLEKETNKIQGWYSEDIHGTWIEPIYETKVIQEEIQDDDGNIVQEKIIQDILVKDGFYDISNIPTPNIEVTDDEWQKAINIDANFYDEATKTFIVKDFRTSEEIEKDNLEKIKLDYINYLKDTEWVESYYIKHLLGVELIPEDSNKWDIIKKRDECKKYLRNL